MTVESNYVIAIATLNDWLKLLAPGFQRMRSKTKTNRAMYAWFFRGLSKFQIIARNCDWFIVLFDPVVIGRSNCFGFGFLKTALFYSCVIETTLLCENGGSVPRAGREWFDIFSWSKERWWMMKLLLNSVIAKYCNLSVSRRSIICLSLRLICSLLTNHDSLLNLAQ